MTKKCVSLVLFFSFGILSANAQYTTSGFFLKPHLIGAAWTLDDLDVDAESGGGGGLGLGYGFSEQWAVFIEGSAATIDAPDGGDYTLAHFDIGARFTLGNASSKFKGILDAAFTGRSAQFDIFGTKVELNGTGITVGVGLNYFLSRSIALDTGLSWTFGSIDEIKVGAFTEDVSVDATSARFILGIAWFTGR